ncbi:hypothetical protein [Vreelandella arcis]|uniref:Uncharacterized protein n=1 Tax=Vreelandella arcis TaxID=416873 RepID=A0A1H0JF01_9GAMM|nr:hypothetical protein [Halomonas arcis]SDO42120.1 hypothetical protein SAMN04487951_12622 [Halomonas arcis]
MLYYSVRSLLNNKILFFIISLFIVNPVKANNLCYQIDGSKVVANDGTYLGVITHEYASNSIINDYGKYGDKYSTESIWNEYGSYGGEYADQSPFNPYTSNPPLIFKNNEAIGRLTVNEHLSGAVNPYILKTCGF